LLALVGYYVWYANKTKVVEPPVKAVDMTKINPDIALARKVSRAIAAYQKEKGSAPKNLDELKGQYLDEATLKNVAEKGFQYEYVNANAYRLRTPKGRAPVRVAAKKTPPTTKPPVAGGGSAAKGPVAPTPQLATTETGWQYDPSGKPDPFKPFILASRPQEEVAPKVRRQLTPLQKMPLSEIQAGLKAIIWGRLGNKALVEDATGKGYVVQEGTYVGQHDGIVKKIYQDRIVVEEYRRHPTKGQLEANEVVLKLKKVEAEE
jgi:type IV pilus assembly protein PilP